MEQKQDFSKLDKVRFYAKDLKTGNIIPLQGTNSHIEIERENRDLIKKGLGHQIKFEIISYEDLFASLEPKEYVPIHKRRNIK